MLWQLDNIQQCNEQQDLRAKENFSGGPATVPIGPPLRGGVTLVIQLCDTSGVSHYLSFLPTKNLLHSDLHEQDGSDQEKNLNAF